MKSARLIRLKQMFDNERSAQDMAVHCSRKHTIMPHDEVKDYIIRGSDWILFGPQDVRNGRNEYSFALIYTSEDRTVRVRAGCRFYTIEQAWKHWGARASLRNSFSSRQGRMCLVIIEFMLLRAQAFGLLSWKQKCQQYTVQTPKEPKRKKLR